MELPRRLKISCTILGGTSSEELLEYFELHLIELRGLAEKVLAVVEEYRVEAIMAEKKNYTLVWSRTGMPWRPKICVEIWMASKGGFLSQKEWYQVKARYLRLVNFNLHSEVSEFLIGQKPEWKLEVYWEIVWGFPPTRTVRS